MARKRYALYGSGDPAAIVSVLNISDATIAAHATAAGLNYIEVTDDVGLDTHRIEDGAAAAYTAPAPVPEIVTALQFITAAAVPQAAYPEAIRPSSPRETGWITQAEAEAWAAASALPTAVTNVIAALPEAQRFPARMAALRMTQVQRSSPLISAALTALSADAEDRDALFRYAATL